MYAVLIVLAVLSFIFLSVKDADVAVGAIEREDSAFEAERKESSAGEPAHDETFLMMSQPEGEGWQL